MARAGSPSPLRNLTAVAHTKKVSHILGFKVTFCIIVSTIECPHECEFHREGVIYLFTVVSAVSIERCHLSPAFLAAFECVCLAFGFIFF